MNTKSFILKHKDNNCAILAIDETTSHVIRAIIIDPTYSPFLGNSDEKKLKKWWEMRAVPGSRKLKNRSNVSNKV